MVKFSRKKITTSPSVSEQLIQRRQQKNVSLPQAAKVTKISIKYLQALEASDYNQLPGEVYAKSFLRVYANYLGLDAVKLLSQYFSEQKIYNKTQKAKNNIDIKKPVKRVFWFNLIVTPKIIKNLIIGILVIVCLVYLGLKVKAIVSPPFLQILSPADNLVTNQKIIEIVGQVEKEAILEINGRQVLTDEKGNFTEMVVLQKGTNIIEIAAAKKHSKKSIIYRKVIVVGEE